MPGVDLPPSSGPRKFGGKKFQFHGTSFSKRRASEVKKNLQGKGNQVRVVKSGKGFFIYKRRS